MQMNILEALKSIAPILLGGGLISFLYNFWQNGKKRQRAAIALYEKYHSIEFYSKIRVPLWKMQLKWFNGTARYKHYRRVVAEGWVNYHTHAELEIYPTWKLRSSYEKCYIDHHVAVSKYTGLTEHQALTIGLEFWATLNILRKKKLISTVDIFKGKYEYDHKFIASLRHAVMKELQNKSTEPMPAWVTETKELEKYFGLRDCDGTLNSVFA